MTLDLFWQAEPLLVSKIGPAGSFLPELFFLCDGTILPWLVYTIWKCKVFCVICSEFLHVDKSGTFNFSECECVVMVIIAPTSNKDC